MDREIAYILCTAIKPPSSEGAFESYKFLRIFLVVALKVDNALKVLGFNGERHLD
jgi:hypothetical protein